MSRLTDEQIRRILLAHGYTIKVGSADLKGYVFDAARAIESAALNALDDLSGALGKGVQPPDGTTELLSAALAVVARWDTPLWKDAPHTAEYIARLRRACEAVCAEPVAEAPEQSETNQSASFIKGDEDLSRAGGEAVQRPGAETER